MTLTTSEPWVHGPPEGFADDHGPAPANSNVNPTPSWDALVTSVPTAWFATPPKPRTWLLTDSRRDGCPGLLPLGKAGMLIGEGGASKTNILVRLAVSVATGSPFLDWFDVATEGRVLLIVGEEDEAEMHRRLYHAAKSRGDFPTDGSIIVIALHGSPCAMLESDERGNPCNAPFADWLYEYLKDKTFALVVIDPLSRFAGLDAEIDNAMATRFVQSVERIATITGATVLVAHHTNKMSRGGTDVTASASRGSSALSDGFRWVASLTLIKLGEPDLDEVVVLSFVKSNYSRKGDPIELRRDKHGALIPLTEAERARYFGAKTGATERQAKSDAREAERRAKVAARDADEATREAAKQLALEAEREARWQQREVALVRILWNHPDGIGTVDLRAALVAALGSLSSGHDAATVARLAEGVAIVPGPHNSKKHVLQLNRLPEALKQRLSALAIQGAL